MSWAALIKCVYEVDPLQCPKCGTQMKIVSFIERHQSEIIEKILRHCKLWKDPPVRPPPKEPDIQEVKEPVVDNDYEFFDRNSC